MTVVYNNETGRFENAPSAAPKKAPAKKKAAAKDAPSSEEKDD